ncbi:agmatinase family protein [uncultured Paraglaciecola sp.]|uniref:agmatinase family protein n=1 Tax=uncultured Paraglaciecola sp. TaxID=1765024 RepID=UPI0025946047|nr:agmatinase family protein [uncultured Paraglaciecola sp.]
MSNLSYLSDKPLTAIKVAITVFLLVGCAAQSVDTASTAVNLPPDDSAKLQLLSEAELAFLRDPGRLKWFNLTEEKVLLQLAQRDAKGIKQYVSDMLEVLNAAKYQTGQGTASTLINGVDEPLTNAADSASIPLNTDAGGFNKRKIVRPAFLDKYKRSPGPISLQRYVHEQDGIPTFANAPVAIRPEDLIAGQVEVAFVGVPLALGSGWRDSQHAPTVLRGMYGLNGYDIAGGVDPSLTLNIADYGNVVTDYLSLELSVQHIREQVSSMIEAGSVPFIVGGDHSIMYPTVAAITDNYGTDNVTVVQLDAHYNGTLGLEHYYSDEQSVSRLLGDNILEGSNLVQVGLRGPSQDKEALEWLLAQGVSYHTMAEVEENGWANTLETTIKQAKKLDKTYISFDMSVLDPAFAPGAGRPIPGGLSIIQARTMVRRLCAETEIVGFEMLDVAPYLDTSYKTALNANYIMHACLTGIAMRKAGKTQANHLDSLALSK